ncbi:MAG: CapA family protein [Candidatus Saccharibacteria bacterium]|nr:CapA family protein [Candidatus Saccharibacteria bacterium]
MRRRRNSSLKVLLMVGAFVCAFVVVLFAVQFFTKTGVFRIPGVVYYSDSLTSEERSVLESIFTKEVDLDKDVSISAENVLEVNNLPDNAFIYNIYVPVTDFYTPETGIEAETATQMFDSGFAKSKHFELIPIEELDFSKRLMSVNGSYYLDDFDSGAVYRIIKFDSEKYIEEIEPLVLKKFEKIYPDKNTVLSFAQTGVTALSRKMNARLNEAGGDAKYFAAEIGPFLSQFDITHTSNESSFTDFATSANICSDKRFIDTLTEIGLDVVELTGNHNQDCGDTAARETIDLYHEKGIKIVGGGKTADEARSPLRLDEKNTPITFLAFNQSTGGATLDDTPGANQYYENTAASQIKEAKARGDFVIVDVQYYECSAYASSFEDPICDYANSSAGDQIGFFRHLIDLGADIVVGTSAHQAQTFELYNDGVIYYGLGNLFFDQIWWPGTTRSLILSHYFYNGKLLQTKLVGTVYDNTMQTKLMDAETTTWWINRLISARPSN